MIKNQGKRKEKHSSKLYKEGQEDWMQTDFNGLSAETRKHGGKSGFMLGEIAHNYTVLRLCLDT